MRSKKSTCSIVRDYQNLSVSRWLAAIKVLSQETSTSNEILADLPYPNNHVRFR